MLRAYVDDDERVVLVLAEEAWPLFVQTVEDGTNRFARLQPVLLNGSRSIVFERCFTVDPMEAALVRAARSLAKAYEECVVVDELETELLDDLKKAVDAYENALLPEEGE